MYLRCSINFRTFGIMFMTSMSCMFAGQQQESRASAHYSASVENNNRMDEEKLRSMLRSLLLLPEELNNEVVEYLGCWHLKYQFTITGSPSAIGFFPKKCNESESIFTWDAELGKVTAWETASGKGLCKLTFADSRAGTINQISRCGRFVAHSSNDNKRRLLVWLVKNKTPVIDYISLAEIFSIKFSPNCLRLAAGFANGMVRVWELSEDDNCNLSKWTLAHELVIGSPQNIAFHSQKNSLVCYGNLGKCWCDLNKPSKYVFQSISKKPVRDFTYSPQGTYSIMLDNEDCEVSMKGEALGVPLRKDQSEQMLGSISPCERFVTTTTHDNGSPLTIMWYMRHTKQGISFEEYATFPGVVHSFSPDGLSFACLNGNKISVYRQSPCPEIDKQAKCIIL